jgi:hypothetical protein
MYNTDKFRPAQIELVWAKWRREQSLSPVVQPLAVSTELSIITEPYDNINLVYPVLMTTEVEVHKLFK